MNIIIWNFNSLQKILFVDEVVMKNLDRATVKDFHLKAEINLVGSKIAKVLTKMVAEEVLLENIKDKRITNEADTDIY